MASPDVLNEVEIEISVGETTTTRHKISLAARRFGPVEEKLISVTGVSGVRIDLSSFSSVRQVIIENLNTSKYVRATWTDATSSEVATSTVGFLQTIVIPSPAVGTSATPLLTLVPETGATCLCRVVVIGEEV